ncbi:HET-domain-containing protein [Hyaloscypha variabilis F]|uniref:HET-domain-containing protein n=1 Tax=Hyaloscypha variabilis (strain UAMH 11265 / GT02V1 / F) TaxID=1149755 RepID=A0A2J6S4W1_HYAVF|nr:HET-domain-containing protein [Hyaloscypha variabilis F]
MRLLHTTKLVVEEFVESQSKSYRYAILSHTWNEEEVTFQDMQGEVPTYKKGFSKLKSSCIQAKKDGYEYIWIDTCCIDKSSSAELSEAINSMYRWYKEAAICYAYLSDVPPREVEDPWYYKSGFRQSRWLTRGWTLQELIAPRQLIFFSKSWTGLGTKTELLNLIYEVTTIDKDVLLYGRNIREALSISRAMSWAARRITTRVEDRSYSLLGIFDVNMPLLYGEGHRAFYRLQEEILKQTDDESIFAHCLPFGYSIHGIEEDPGSILAVSPDCFSESGDIFLYTRDARLHAPLEHSVYVPTLATNRGLQVNSLGCPCTHNYGPHNSIEVHGWLMILNCGMRNDILSRPAVFLRQLDSGSDRFERFNSAELLLLCGWKKIMSISTRVFRDQSKKAYVDQSVQSSFAPIRKTSASYYIRRAQKQSDSRPSPAMCLGQKNTKLRCSRFCTRSGLAKLERTGETSFWRPVQ